MERALMWREAVLAKRYLIGALLASLILHAAIISRLAPTTMPAPQDALPALTVMLQFPPAIKSGEVSPDNHLPAPQVKIAAMDEKTSHTPPLMRSVIAGANETSIPTTQLDMNRLLEQVRNDARQNLRNTEALPELAGDYYGTYSGSDSGTFYVHLDKAGHASGSGQSNSYGISFAITGEAAGDGRIQMSGSGIAGQAKFNGKLDMHSGKISGSWLAASVGSGTFSGQHE
ncbi:MAG: hypothetical protein PHY62_11175 [Gallionella sp.]|nr:hypothetical protein [Gallionella sp.]